MCKSRFSVPFFDQPMHARMRARMHTGDQLRRRRTEFALEAEEDTGRLTKLAKHNKRCGLLLRRFLSSFVVVSGS